MNFGKCVFNGLRAGNAFLRIYYNRQALNYLSAATRLEKNERRKGINLFADDDANIVRKEEDHRVQHEQNDDANPSVSKSLQEDNEKMRITTARTLSNDPAEVEKIFKDGLELLRSNQLDRFRADHPVMSEHLKMERTKDNYFWILVDAYYSSLKVQINVEETFNLYLDVFSTSKVGENEISMKNGSTARRMIFSPRTMFNLLNLAYPAYSKRVERHRRYNTLNTRKALEETTYRKMLNTIESLSSKRRRRLLHGAVLLENGKALEFFDEYKMADEKLSVEDVEYLCRVAGVVKRPRILEPLIKFGYFLPSHDPTIANVYKVLALLYGQQQDVESLERLWKLLAATTFARRLPAFRHPLNRIRHFYRCANVVAPVDLVKMIRQADVR